MPGSHVVLTDQIYLAIFVEGHLYSDYFCQITFNSDNISEEKMFKISYIGT